MSEKNPIFTIIQGKNDNLQPIFSVLLKRSFGFGGNEQLVRSEHDAPLREADAYYDNGDPQWSTVEFENELYPFKPFTDVVIIGNAHAPGGKLVSQLNVGVEVASHRKVLRISGNRHCSHPL
jgi:hypothetical protein